MKTRRATISDVARHAGVSKATVSAVLNETGSVKATTRDRVVSAMELLNYRPTQIAGRAAARKTKSIGLLIKEIDNPYYAEIVLGARGHANENGYTLLVASSEGEYDAERRAVELLQAKDVDGLIATPVLDEHADLSHFFELKRRNFPFVLLEEIRGVPASLVDVDNVEASRRAVEHLIEQGHTRIVHFAGPSYSTHSLERIDGVRRACSASRLSFTDADIIASGAHLEDGYRAALSLFGARDPRGHPTAATCYNDLVAVGVCRALRELGLDIPGDVSVVGYDDIPLAEYLPVALTTVVVPKLRMGQIASEMLIRHIESKEAVPPQKVFLDAELIVRGSTGPAAGSSPRAAADGDGTVGGVPRPRRGSRARDAMIAHGEPPRRTDSSSPPASPPATTRMRDKRIPLVIAFLATLGAGCTSTPQPEARPDPAPPAPRPAAEASAPLPVPSWRPAAAPLMTRWAADVSPDRVLPEYPRPQMVRPRWQTLNGLWEFAVVDSSSVPGVSGDPHRLAHPSRPGGRGPEGPLPLPPPSAFSTSILVPFAPEAALSGVGRHADRVGYRRTFRRPQGLGADERLLLHFGACDWHCTVYVNGRQVADHTGGYDAFEVDITDALRPDGEQELVVAVYDPTDKFGQPRGKQVSKPEGIWYTAVTGIWQTVWLEPVPASSVEGLRMTPDVAGGVLHITVRGRGTRAGQRVTAVAMSNGQEVGRVDGAPGEALRLPVSNPRLWGPDDPFLYDLRVTLREGDRELDRVDSYFGMRTVGLTTDPNGFRRITLNGRTVFQLGPLDQGWWPDGLYTAPTDEALRFDVEMTKALGFNTTRKHIKVEPARWYYHADRLGLPVWQDMPSGWNDNAESRQHFERELRAMLEDLHNHPSIVVWVPFNEKWGQFDTPRIVGIIQQLDSSRLVNDASGWQHENVGDMIDVHRYQGPQAMRGANGRVSVVGEYGGLGLKESGHTWAPEGWGYSGLFETRAALSDRYDLLARRLYRDRDTHGVGAGIYTQLTDVEMELNGFFTYDRAVAKFDTARTAAVNRGYAPYVLPELPEFTDSVRVTIVQGTPTEVRYTLDGSEPTMQSAVYHTPFTVRQSIVVRARAFAGGGVPAGAVRAAPEARMEYRKDAGRAPAMVAARDLAPGLAYAFYRDTTTEPAFRMHWPVRWQVERPDVRPTDVAPHKSGTVRNVTLAPSDTGELFGLRFTGYIRVPRTGVYTFTALSDDGSALWIGDRNVFWSVGQSPKTTESWGQIALRAGLHPITLTHFQAYGPMALELYVEGPGTRRQRVPDSWLLRDRTPAAPAAPAASPTSQRRAP